jgi:aspartyl protease family protein
MKGHLIAAGVWLGLVAAGYAAFQAMDRRAETITGCDGGAAPSEVVVPAARDGHFYVDGTVGGRPVRFLVDTGATYVSIDSGTAQSASLGEGARALFDTAAGRVEGRIVRGVTVGAACLAVPDLSVAVNPGLGPVGLLGQNFLRRFEVVQTDRELRLRAR